MRTSSVGPQSQVGQVDLGQLRSWASCPVWAELSTKRSTNEEAARVGGLDLKSEPPESGRPTLDLKWTSTDLN